MNSVGRHRVYLVYSVRRLISFLIRKQLFCLAILPNYFGLVANVEGLDVA